MKKVKTAPRVVEIKVTAKDIKEGEPGEYQSCPIALAVQRKFKKAQGVGVDKYLEYYLNEGKDICAQYYKADLPKAARMFIQRFDSSAYAISTDERKALFVKWLKPFSFKVKIKRIY